MGRKLSTRIVQPLGLGCMSLSHAYGTPPPRDHAVRLLNEALDLGYDHLDTASLYGLGQNESLIAAAIGHRRKEYFLASKCGLARGPEGRIIDGSPAKIRQTLEESLTRLKCDHIDLYYLHRLDPKIAVEESVGALADLKAEGKIGAIGLSEISAATLRRAHAEHPIAAVQNEYSLWSRNCELGIVQASAELGVALVAFSPVGRGWLTGAITAPADIPAHDLRSTMPRFTAENLASNQPLLDILTGAARNLGLTPAQLSLAWVLAQGDHIHAIPGTASIDHLHENFAASADLLPGDVLDSLTAAFAPQAIAGARYPASLQIDIDTEEFAATAAHHHESKTSTPHCERIS